MHRFVLRKMCAHLSLQRLQALSRHPSRHRTLEQPLSSSRPCRAYNLSAQRPARSRHKKVIFLANSKSGPFVCRHHTANRGCPRSGHRQASSMQIHTETRRLTAKITQYSLEVNPHRQSAAPPSCAKGALASYFSPCPLRLRRGWLRRAGGCPFYEAEPLTFAIAYITVLIISRYSLIAIA